MTAMALNVCPEMSVIPYPDGGFMWVIRRPESPLVYFAGIEPTEVSAQVFGAHYWRAACLEIGAEVPQGCQQILDSVAAQLQLFERPA